MWNNQLYKCNGWFGHIKKTRKSSFNLIKTHVYMTKKKKSELLTLILETKGFVCLDQSQKNRETIDSGFALHKQKQKQNCHSIV